MCCHINIRPLNISIALTELQIGGFVPTYEPKAPLETALLWSRDIPEEGHEVIASLSSEGELQLRIHPAISNYAQHAGLRKTAGIYFEIAAKYAEKVNGKIVQTSNVIGCAEGQANFLVLANYPNQPMSFDKICNGFQELFMHTHLGEDDATE